MSFYPLSDRDAAILDLVSPSSWPWNASGSGTFEMEGATIEWKQTATDNLDLVDLDADEDPADWFMVDYKRSSIATGPNFKVTMFTDEGMDKPCREREHYNAIFVGGPVEFEYDGDYDAALKWLRECGFEDEEDDQ